MEIFNNIVNTISSVVWSNVLVVLCLAAGIYFSVRLKFPQLRLFKDMVHLLLKVDPDSNSGITPFQAFATTVGSRVEMGSVAGVATGIFFGGPGAVFWMWVLGLLGAATALIESTLAQAYKTKINGEYIGGILCVCLGLVVFGGVKRIGKFAEKAAPIMCLVYMLMAIGIIVLYFRNISGKSFHLHLV